CLTFISGAAKAAPEINVSIIQRFHRSMCFPCDDKVKNNFQYYIPDFSERHVIKNKYILNYLN
ncbi:TPA: hypothetical protein ACHF1R_004357, partial [Escherichia coli]